MPQKSYTTCFPCRAVLKLHNQQMKGIKIWNIDILWRHNKSDYLKDYDYVILWLDYFNKNLSRTKGRKLKKDQAIFDPTLSDLVDAAKECGYNPQQEQINDGARHPRRAFVKSAYIALPKKEAVKKNTLILNIAQKMKNRTKWSKH